MRAEPRREWLRLAAGERRGGWLGPVGEAIVGMEVKSGGPESVLGGLAFGGTW